MNEAPLRKPLPRCVVHRQRLFVIQVPFRADRDHFVQNPLQMVIPIPVFFHERIDPSMTCRPGRENQYVKL